MKSWKDYGLDFPQSFEGERYSTCPKCSSSRKKKGAKCLSANGDKLAWVCHHCGWSGTIKEGVDHGSDPFQWSRTSYRQPDYGPPSKLPPEIVDWFRKRGISVETLVRNRIGYESVYMPQVEGQVSAIRFPFFRNGTVINVKSRTLDKQFRLETNAERIFYGMDDIDGDTAIIVEGEIDKLSVEEAGFRNCMSVPDGAPAPGTKDYTNKFAFLENSEKLLADIKTFILACDADDPGRVLQEELARRLGKHRCRRVQLPGDCKDANEVLTKYGKGKLREVVQGARDYPIAGLFEISDISTQIDVLYRAEAVAGEFTGWHQLDDHYTVRPGELTILTGIPGHGKSEFLDAMMINLATLVGWRFAVFSPENQPLERHVAKLAEKYVEKPFFPGYHSRMTEEELEEAERFLLPHFTFISPPEDQLTVDHILDLCRQAILRKGVKGLVIDPWNEIDHSRPVSMTETEYISSSLTKLRRFARQYGIHLWLVAHPTKLRKLENGLYPVPTPYDISGSAAWRNKADNCLTIYRPLKGTNVELHIQKIRFKDVGKIGMVTLDYDPLTGRYS